MYAVDDEIQDRIDPKAMFAPSLPRPAALCKKCKELDFSTPGFNFTYSTHDLKARAGTCGLCKMLWGLCESHKKTEQTEVKFVRYQSTLRMDDENTPVASMIRSPGMKDQIW
jgi:hypothetical protein